MTTATIEQQFGDAIEAALRSRPHTIIADGQWHDFSTNGDPNDDAGRYFLRFSDAHYFGYFQDWRSATKGTWTNKPEGTLTQSERAKYRKHIEAAKQRRAEEDRRRHAEVAESAKSIWAESVPASTDHPYLVGKGVDDHGLKVYRGNLCIAGLAVDGALIVPLRNALGGLRTLQFIAPSGEKRFLPGGEKLGCSFAIGTIDKSTSRIGEAEGFATAASIHRATDLPMVVTFDAGNLLSVSKALRAKHPTAQIIICADDDFKTPGNPGLTKATEAAEAINGLWVIPQFGTDRPDRATDFNDLARLKGLDVMKAQIHAAINGHDAGAPEAEYDYGLDPDLDPHGPTTAAVASSNSDNWPQLDPAARYGLAGEIVELLEPHTEADPVALLGTTLSEFGCTVGRAPHVVLDGSRHPLLFWPIITGKSSKSRKGSSDRRVAALFRESDPDWTRGECRGTLSSGEGLVFAVRDPSSKDEKVVDPGVGDKRLLLVQSEFGSVLGVMKREGNSLSGVVRDAWDGQDLCPMTKNNLIRATAPHIAIVGHITVDELKRNLTGTEMSNGFANRFGFLLVRRSKELPESSDPCPKQHAQIIQRLRQAVRHGRSTSRIMMAESARIAWRAIYSDLSADRPGIVGSLLGRAEAQVQRLAAIYALLDLRSEVELVHLEAALALWQYIEASTIHLFGDTVGDSDADTILAALRQSGEMTDTDISALFGFNRSAGRLTQAKKILQTAGLVECFQREKEGKGRRVTFWRVKTN